MSYKRTPDVKRAATIEETQQLLDIIQNFKFPSHKWSNGRLINQGGLITLKTSLAIADETQGDIQTMQLGTLETIAAEAATRLDELNEEIAFRKAIQEGEERFKQQEKAIAERAKAEKEQLEKEREEMLKAAREGVQKKRKLPEFNADGESSSDEELLLFAERRALKKAAAKVVRRVEDSEVDVKVKKETL